MRYRIAVDTGGTFSDVVLLNEAGELSLSKAPTTPERVFDGISEALSFAAAERDLSLEALLLSNTDLFIYGTTAATNAIITGRTARTAFLTTRRAFRTPSSCARVGSSIPSIFGRPTRGPTYLVA